LFIKEVRKIVPSLKLNELHYANGIGGTRPQIVNNTTRKLEMGEAKLAGDNIIFNITPSPGASTCLGNAYSDTQEIMKFLGDKFKFNKEAFEKDLM
jgi:malate dehydrogenase (quinone)